MNNMFMLRLQTSKRVKSLSWFDSRAGGPTTSKLVCVTKLHSKNNPRPGRVPLNSTVIQQSVHRPAKLTDANTEKMNNTASNTNFIFEFFPIMWLCYFFCEQQADTEACKENTPKCLDYLGHLQFYMPLRA